MFKIRNIVIGSDHIDQENVIEINGDLQPTDNENVSFGEVNLKLKENKLFQNVADLNAQCKFGFSPRHEIVRTGYAGYISQINILRTKSV